ncbi:MAG: CvpA family protein [Acetobacteraceae bacterium]|jgi:membrane protein required for colicin V production
MTWVDFAVLGVIAVSALLAFMRGLVREVLGIGAWIGAGVAALWALPLVRPRFQHWMGISPWNDPVAFVAVFVAALIVLILIAHAVGRLVRRSALGGLDRTLGLVFGLVRGAALIILAYIFVGLVKPVDQWPEAVLQARSIGLVYDGAKWAVDHVPPGDFHPPPVYPPPAGRKTTAEALLHATPQGSALGRPAASTAARD